VKEKIIVNSQRQRPYIFLSRQTCSNITHHHQVLYNIYHLSPLQSVFPNVFTLSLRIFFSFSHFKRNSFFNVTPYVNNHISFIILLLQLYIIFVSVFSLFVVYCIFMYECTLYMVCNVTGYNDKLGVMTFDWKSR